MGKKNSKKYKNVMLIDDNEIDNFINQKMIEGCNFAENVYIHSSGKSAIELIMNMSRIKDGSIDHIPQIIFLDINMPLMDGFQFIDEFEKLPAHVKKATEIVMLTSSINPADVERSNVNQYVTKYVNKPLTQAHLDII